jgi:hypothetical protein
MKIVGFGSRRIIAFGVSVFLASTMTMIDGGRALASHADHRVHAGARSTHDTGSTPASTPADAVDRLGNSPEYADVYGGMKVLTDDESRIEVYLTVLDPAVESAFASAGGSSSALSFAKVRNSMRTMLSLQRRLTEHAESLRAQGVDLVSYGPDQAVGELRIAVTAATSEVTDLLGDLLGASNIEVVQERPIQTIATKTASQRVLFGHAWRVKRVQRFSAAGARMVHLHGGMTVTWSHRSDTVIKVGACTSATVVIAQHRQTFGTFTTAAKTGCGSHESAAVNGFVYGRLLTGTVTWRLAKSKLVLTHSGVGRMVLAGAR